MATKKNGLCVQASARSQGSGTGHCGGGGMHEGMHSGVQQFGVGSNGSASGRAQAASTISRRIAAASS